MIIIKNQSDTPYIRNGPVQRVKVEEYIRHKWVYNLLQLASHLFMFILENKMCEYSIVCNVSVA